MDIKKRKSKAINDFLLDMYQKGKSDVICPICNKPLKFEGDTSAYSVFCETPNCLKVNFRGI